MRRVVWSVLVVALGIWSPVAWTAELPLIADVELQPLAAATERLIEALEFVGSPLAPEQKAKLQEAVKDTDAARALKTIQAVLDPLCVAGVTINAESRVSVVEGPAKKELIHQGWRTFLVKVQNDAGINPELKLESPNVAPLFKRSTSSASPKREITLADIPTRFLDADLFGRQPMKKTLSGLALEYRILQLYTRESGRREAKLGFNVGQGTQDIGFRNAVSILFHCVPSVEVVLDVKDFDGQPTTAAFVFRDRFNRVYPNPSRRLAPDLFFHNQVYRGSGESVHLPPGEYTVQVSRGPEYLVESQSLSVKPGVSQKAEFTLHRWTHAAKRRWFSGDHHVHAAGCAHYENPTEGVTPADMMRHILGEDLNVGCVLSWGPCWYVQKRYFEGKPSALSQPNYLMRYDVEVSGFPSSHAGHLCLLRLYEDDYPQTELIEQWPSWTQPVLAWGQKQGGVVGYSHSGWGLALPDVDGQGNRVPNGRGKAASSLPDYAMPPFDGIGANEFVVTTAHGVCDFISAVDTPSIWELNVWYHTLNCGMTTRISGETDFPCIYGDKVGLGRIYVKLDPGEELTYDKWIVGLKNGRSYCGDGLSHVYDLKVNGAGVGEANAEGQISRVNLDEPGKVTVEFDATAWLAETPNAETEAIRNQRLDHKPYWHLERCRLGESRKVPVEIVVNGQRVAGAELTADGSVAPMKFEVPVTQSSWIAVRILPSIHTNPVFVHVGGKPIRASRKSAEWCIQAVDTCWKSKEPKIRFEEKAAAKAAYNQAKEIYAAALKEAVTD